MGYIVINCEQGSEEWHKARAGVITASMFGVARSRVGGLDEKQKLYVKAIKDGRSEEIACELSGYKKAPTAEAVKRALAGLPVGDYSEASKDYAFRLAIERISGEPLDEGFQTWQMKRGQDLEPLARSEHEIAAGIFVRRAGFITTEDGAFGASADGFFTQGIEKGCEYKCLVSPDRLRDVIVGDDISDFIDQVQGCMWISGLTEWHFGLYCPALEPVNKHFTLKVVQRDDNYINELEKDLWQFKLMVDDFERRLRLKAA